ncbi:MAG: hypothetical protein MUC49_10075 [Raineya sp.]|jgi:translation elongation factor EF-Tu-like GTPase|nr:hypothetical protein [Raineya sp.]
MKIASFEIIDTFRITGRGGVLVGNIIDGVFNIGNFIEIFNKRIKILGLEMVDRISLGISNVALVVPFDDYDEIKNLEIKNKTFDIFEQSVS